MFRWPTAFPLAFVAVAAGCAPLPKSASLLPTSPAADHVALEVFFVHLAADAATLTETLWSAVDEQAIDLDVRRRLASNGFLVGRVGGQPPAAVTELLQVSGDAPAPSVDEAPVIVPTKAPLMHRKLIDVYQTETPNRVVVTGDRERHPKLVVLYRDETDGAVRGQTFKNAQGILLTKVLPQFDGRVKLDIVPEVEYGESRQQIEPGEGGAWTVQFAPPRKTFDGLRLSAMLLPGEMLIFGCRSDCPGSLGQQFFTDRQQDVQSQTIVLIRLVQAKSNDLFGNDPSNRQE
ncbi:MAG: hypothetical protein ACREHD_25600 [Pirellulales bacterium]